MEITSPKNSLLQDIRKAASSGRPTSEGLVVAEGPHLLEEALRGRWRLEQVFVTRGARDRFSRLIARLQCEVIELPDRAFSGTASTETTQGVLALLRPKVWTWADLLGKPTLLVVLDGIQDPGNAGTIVRSAEAFGASGILFMPGTVHVSNGKLLRAASGSMFRMPYLEQFTAVELDAAANGAGIDIYALSARASIDISQVDLVRGCALAVGGEGAGVTPEVLSFATAVGIRMAKIESLNAAIAGSIALFEAARQRSGI